MLVPNFYFFSKVLLPITIPNPCLEEQVFIEYKVNLWEFQYLNWKPSINGRINLPISHSLHISVLVMKNENNCNLVNQ